MTQDFAHLHQLAEHAATNVATVASQAPASVCISEKGHSVVLWRSHSVQVELVSVAREGTLEEVAFPCDQVIRFLGGQLDFTIDKGDGEKVTISLNNETEAHRGRHIEIKAGHKVTGSVRQAGAVYLSVQNHPTPLKESRSILDGEGWA